MRTEIDINYYEEIKRKADMFDKIDEIMKQKKYNLTNFLKEYGKIKSYAKIGKLTERAFEFGKFIYDIVETYEGILFEYSEVENVEELLEWLASEQEVSDYTDGLERLVKIGRAIEQAFDCGYEVVFQDYDYEEDEMYTMDSIQNIDKLLEWAEDEDK